MEKSASFSKCRGYRYLLTRTWDEGKGFVKFIALNPSTADETDDDPTIRRCMGFANKWGYGGIAMINLFAFRATEPKEMMSAPFPIGEAERNEHTLKMANICNLVIAAWGNDGSYMNQDKIAKKLVNKLHCLRINKSGQPAHPLYLPGDLKPILWEDQPEI